ncbi:Microtubule-associated tumor suppressor candidate 2 [Liparis tanakae]|uniref:Microtubule-associated tumor suppressor candidate 2 n=1 Tax=Liparis tanakae TaxID=230148 RepID=A0A4Z2IMA6_9TELE|nr:Microtubule-associated tumor suppressor candidate 2 [Liparis tanakae]
MATEAACVAISRHITHARGRPASSSDANRNSPPSHPQEKQGCPQYYGQDRRHEEGGGHHRNGPTSDGVLGQRRKAGFEERVMPPRRQQLVRPLCQTEVGRARSSSETNETGPPSPPNLAPDSYRQFAKSSLREPSDFSNLYSSQLRQPSQAAQREAPPTEKPAAAAAWRHPSPSNPSAYEKRPQTQLTYRRNCSSPNRTGVDSRSSTPPHSPLRTPQGSPHQPPSMYLVSRNVPGVVRHIPSGCNPAGATSAQGYSCMRAPVKTNISTSGIPKAPLTHQQSSNYNPIPRESSPSPKLKPKGVRPKIITSVRKTPQFKPQVADGPYQVSSLPSRLSAYSHGHSPAAFRDPSKADAETRGAPALSASNLLYDKYRQEMQATLFPPGAMSRSIKPPGHTHTVPPAHTHSHTAPPNLGSKADAFYGTPSEVGRSVGFKGSSAEDALQSRAVPPAGGSGGSLLRSGRGLRLGLGAVHRMTTGSAKGRGPSQGQRSALVFSQPVQPVSPATNQKTTDDTDDQVFTHPPPLPPPPAAAAPPPPQPQAMSSRSLLPKTSQSGLRPPGFSSSRHPAGRLAAFGFVRSSSVSSASSAHSADSAQSDPSRAAHRESALTLTTSVNLNGTFQKYTDIIPTLRSSLSSIPS